MASKISSCHSKDHVTIHLTQCLERGAVEAVFARAQEFLLLSSARSRGLLEQKAHRPPENKNTINRREPRARERALDRALPTSRGDLEKMVHKRMPLVMKRSKLQY